MLRATLKETTIRTSVLRTNNFFQQIDTRRNTRTKTQAYLYSTTTNSTPPIDENKKTVRILSIDGGGIRGIIPLKVLQKIEKDVNSNLGIGPDPNNPKYKRIYQLFDVIAGTSSGGLSAMGLSVPNLKVDKEFQDSLKSGNIDSLLELFQTDGSGIFGKKKRTIWLEKNLWGWGEKISYLVGKLRQGVMRKYSDESMKKIFQRYFNNTKVSDASTNFLVPAYDIDNRRVFVFHNFPHAQNTTGKLIADQPTGNDIWMRKDHNFEDWGDFYLKDVARVISAAPTYFKPQKMKEKDVKGFSLVDGGIFLNNPSMLAYIHARKIFPSAENFFVVSLGSGEPPQKKHNFWLGGAIGWGIEFIDVLSGGTNRVTDSQLDNLLATILPQGTEKNYFRLQVIMDQRILLDATTPRAVSNLESLSRNITDGDDMEHIVRELSKDRTYPIREEGFPPYDPQHKKLMENVKKKREKDKETDPLKADSPTVAT